MAAAIIKTIVIEMIIPKPFVMNQATKIPDNATIDPGERSIPVVIITNVSPMAIIPNIAI